MTQPLPFRQVVLKVHSRCDLACDHCYVYEHADQSWRTRPKAMSDETASLAADRIAEHAGRHQLSAVHVVLHGGEPLLLGVERTRSVLTVLRSRIGPVTALDLRIHTNGVLLNNEFCALFEEFDVKVGVSLDGDRAANDRHRRYADGRTSHPQVLRALQLLRQPQFVHLYAGILCTIDIASDPIAVYEALAEQRPPRVDLLLPHATWEHLPARTARSRTEYADWLTAIFDRWTSDGRPFGIRFFDSVLAALDGQPSQTESLGLTPSDLLVIETDGTIEQADSLKTAYDGAPATGLDIFQHTLDDAARNSGIAARQRGLDGLCETCRECPVVKVCGGGLYAHRYRQETEFDNPSVYCDDLMATILHIEAGSACAEVANPTHTLSAEEFDTLASGCGDAEAITRLAEAQASIRRMLIARLIRARTCGDSHAAVGDLLVRLDAEAPGAVTRILAHPATRSWTTRCLDALDSNGMEPDDLGYLRSLAIAAAARAGIEATLSVPVVDDVVQLPTLGYAEVVGRGDAVVSVAGSHIEIVRDGCMLRLQRVDQSSDPAWRPVARVAHASGVSACLHFNPADVKVLEDAFPNAAQLLARYLPEYLSGLRTGLTDVVPVGSVPFDTIGALPIEPTGEPAELVIRLLRAFQRTKLHALFDLFELVEPTISADEIEKTTGLLYRAYESLAVEAFQTARLGTLSECQTPQLIGQLRELPQLTELGRRFVAGMELAVAPPQTAPVEGARE